MENEAALPVEIQTLRYRELEIWKVCLTRTEHSGPLNIGILLQLYALLSREEHRQ